MVNYQNGKIYKIINDINCDVYYGSTANKYLSVRLAKHRCAYKKYLEDGENFLSSFIILETGKFHIVLVENYPCNNRDELRARERYYVDNNDCVNLRTPYITMEEFLDKRKKASKNYRENNQDKVKEDWNSYYEKNKEKIKQNRRDRFLNEGKITCNICGSIITKSNLERHKRSNKCKNNICLYNNENSNN